MPPIESTYIMTPIESYRCQYELSLFTYFVLRFRNSNFFIRTRFRHAPHDPTRAPPRPPPAGAGEAGAMRRDEETAGREVDLISTYFEKGTDPSLISLFGSLTAHHEQYRVGISIPLV
ncbi:unnamed protein product [Laminaria digitata]